MRMRRAEGNSGDVKFAPGRPARNVSRYPSESRSFHVRLLQFADFVERFGALIIGADPAVGEHQARTWEIGMVIILPMGRDLRPFLPEKTARRTAGPKDAVSLKWAKKELSAGRSVALVSKGYALRTSWAAARLAASCGNKKSWRVLPSITEESSAVSEKEIPLGTEVPGMRCLDGEIQTLPSFNAKRRNS